MINPKKGTEKHREKPKDALLLDELLDTNAQCCGCPMLYKRSSVVNAAGRWDFTADSVFIYKTDNNAKSWSLRLEQLGEYESSYFTAWSQNNPENWTCLRLLPGATLNGNIWAFAIDTVAGHGNAIGTGEYCCVSLDAAGVMLPERIPYDAAYVTDSIQGTFPVMPVGERHVINYMGDTHTYYLTNGNSGFASANATSQTAIDCGIATATMNTADYAKGYAGIEAAVAAQPLVDMYVMDSGGVNNSTIAVYPDSIVMYVRDNGTSQTYVRVEDGNVRFSPGNGVWFSNLQNFDVHSRGDIQLRAHVSQENAVISMDTGDISLEVWNSEQATHIHQMADSVNVSAGPHGFVMAQSIADPLPLSVPTVEMLTPWESSGLPSSLPDWPGRRYHDTSTIPKTAYEADGVTGWIVLN